MKKNIYTLLVCMTAALAANAQISKGTILLGGNVNFNYFSEGLQPLTQFKAMNSSFTLTPSFGKAIKDNLVLGFDLNFQRQESKDTDPANLDDNKTQTYGGGIFLEEYKPMGKGFYIFIAEALNGAYAVVHDNGVPESKAYSLSLGLNPGISYTICPHIMVATSLQNLFHINYSHTHFGDQASDFPATNNFSAGSSLSTAVQALSVGVVFLFRS